MQTIVTTDYYKINFIGGFTGTDEELEKLLEASYIIIYNETCGRIANFDTLPKATQTAVKDAICWQVEYIAENGGLSFLNEGSFTNVSLGSFSYSSGGDGGSDGKLPICNLSFSLLLQTGLMYKGVDVI